MKSRRRDGVRECVFDDLAVDTGVISADQLAESEAIAAEPEETSEDAYRAALDGEVEWDIEADGTLARTAHGVDEQR